MQHFNGRQYFAFNELKEGTAACRDVRNLISDAVFVDGRQGVATTSNREGLAVGNGLGQHFGAVAELVKLEHTYRTVPQNGLGRFQQVSEAGSVQEAQERFRDRKSVV